MIVMTVKEYADRIVQNAGQVIIGKDDTIRQIVICFLAGGHVLLEDLPGTGKTMLLRAFARNLINAVPGQKVTISTESGRVYSAALLVYIVPLLFFVLGFAAARLLGASEGLSILVSFLCLIPAALLLIRSQKRKTAENQIRFDIIS